MKVLLMSLMLILVVLCCTEAEGDSERQCIKLEGECTKNKDNCCAGHRCRCYDKIVNGVKAEVRCWCFEKDVTYKPLFEI
nr:Tx-866 [Heteropoda pingtungensis]